MDPSNCPEGKVTDRIEPTRDTNGSIDLCATEFYGALATALVVVVLRIVLLMYNVHIFLSLRSRRREQFGHSGGKKKGVDKKATSKSNADRFPITLVSEGFSTLFMTLFATLTLSNTIDNTSTGATGLVLYALALPPYFLGTILSTIKMVNLSRKVVMKNIRAQKEESENSTSNPTNIAASTLRKISEFRANHVMQAFLVVSIIGTIGLTVVIIAILGAQPPASDVLVWTKAFFGFVTISGYTLMLLIIYHTHMTINVVKSSVLYKQWVAVNQVGSNQNNSSSGNGGNPKVSTHNQDQAIANIRRLIQRLWVRLYVNVFTLLFPTLMSLQIAGVLPFTFEMMICHYYLTLVASLVAMLVFKPSQRNRKVNNTSSSNNSNHRAQQNKDNRGMDKQESENTASNVTITKTQAATSSSQNIGKVWQGVSQSGSAAFGSEQQGGSEQRGGSEQQVGSSYEAVTVGNPGHEGPETTETNDPTPFSSNDE